MSIAIAEHTSLVPTPHALPVNKVEFLGISWAYYQNVVRANEVVR